jgi:Skp family chaperone for outer membrane proteins
MKAKTIVIAGLICLLVLLTGFGTGAVKSTPKDEPAGLMSKVGVVNVRKIFQTCKRNEKYKLQTKADQEKAINELQQLRAEVKAAEAGLDTRKPGTKDYLDLTQEIAQKKALLPIKQDYYEQQFSSKDKEWSENLYKDILSSVNKVAEQKHLDMVFEKDTPEFPIERAEDLMMIIRTNKLLYANGGVDITADVTGLVDANSL